MEKLLSGGGGWTCASYCQGCMGSLHVCTREQSATLNNEHLGDSDYIESGRTAMAVAGLAYLFTRRSCDPCDHDIYDAFALKHLLPIAMTSQDNIITHRSSPRHTTPVILHLVALAPLSVASYSERRTLNSIYAPNSRLFPIFLSAIDKCFAVVSSLSSCSGSLMRLVSDTLVR
jgi:hypothetical protein